MPRNFFDVKDGHRLFDASGFVCEDDTDAIIRATVVAIGVSLDKPEDDPERRIAKINDADERSATCPYAGKIARIRCALRPVSTLLPALDAFPVRGGSNL